MGAENPLATRYAQAADIINDPRANGKQYGYINTFAAGEVGSLTSVVLTQVAPSTRYSLTVALGHGLNIGCSRYTIELLVNNISVATQTLNGSAIPSGTFVELTAVFDSPSSGAQIGTSIQVRLTHSNITGTTQSLQGHFDNVRLDASPTTVSYTVTPSAGANGSISPNTVQTVASGGSVGFTATPNSGYVVDQWLVGGSVVQTGGTTYTVSNVTANKTVQVTFKAVTYSVTPSAGANGSISPNTVQTVASGGSVGFTATPNSGYVVNQWLVGGSAVQTGGTTYTLSNITANKTVQVTFNPATVTYTVTPSAGANGSISPNTFQTVASGGSAGFTATPNSGYVVNQWLVGASVVQTRGTTFTLSNITANTTVQVTFTSSISQVYDLQIVGFTGRKEGPVTGFVRPFTDAYGQALTPRIDPGYFGDFSFDAAGNLLYRPLPGFTGYDFAAYTLQSPQTMGTGSLVLQSSDRKQPGARRTPSDQSIPIVLRRGLPANVWLELQHLPEFPKSGVAFLSPDGGIPPGSFTGKLGKVSRRASDPRGTLRFPVSAKAPIGPGEVVIMSAAGDSVVTRFRVNLIDKKDSTTVVNPNGNDDFLGGWRTPGKPSVNIYGLRSGGVLDHVTMAEVIGSRVKGKLIFDDAGVPEKVEVGGSVINLKDWSIMLKGSGQVIYPPASAPSGISRQTRSATAAIAPVASVENNRPVVHIFLKREDGTPVEGASVALSIGALKLAGYGDYPAVEIGDGAYDAPVNLDYVGDTGNYDACATLGEATKQVSRYAPQIVQGLQQLSVNLAGNPDPYSQSGALACQVAIPVVELIGALGPATGELTKIACDKNTELVLRAARDRPAFVKVTYAPGLKAPVKSPGQILSSFSTPERPGLPDFHLTLKIPKFFHGTLSEEYFSVPFCSDTLDVRIGGIVDLEVEKKNGKISGKTTVKYLLSTSVGGVPQGDFAPIVTGDLPVINNHVSGLVKTGGAGQFSAFLNLDLSLNSDDRLTGSVELNTHLRTSVNNSVLCYEGDQITVHSVQ